MTRYKVRLVCSVLSGLVNIYAAGGLIPVSFYSEPSPRTTLGFVLSISFLVISIALLAPMRAEANPASKVGHPLFNQASEVEGDPSRGAVSLGSPSIAERHRRRDRMRNRRPWTMRQQRVRMPMPSPPGPCAIEPAREQLGSPARPPVRPPISLIEAPTSLADRARPDFL
jgi:hypothetical protein